jgi:hypothetical protein
MYNKFCFFLQALVEEIKGYLESSIHKPIKLIKRQNNPVLCDDKAIDLHHISNVAGCVCLVS